MDIGFAVAAVLLVIVGWYAWKKGQPPPPPPPPTQRKFDGKILIWGGLNNQTPYGGQFGKLDQALAACRADSRCAGVGTWSKNSPVYSPYGGGPDMSPVSDTYNLFTGNMVVAGPNETARAWLK